MTYEPTEEEKRMIEMRSQGKFWSEIAEELKVPRNYVFNRLRTVIYRLNDPYRDAPRPPRKWWNKLDLPCRACYAIGAHGEWPDKEAFVAWLAAGHNPALHIVNVGKKTGKQITDWYKAGALDWE